MITYALGGENKLSKLAGNSDNTQKCHQKFENINSTTSLYKFKSGQI